MKLFVLPLLFSVAALAQTPVPPACLSGPVTKGNVTLNCSLIDNTGSFGADPGLFSGGVQYVLQVRVTSSDPDVSAIGIAISSLVEPGGTSAPYTVTEWRSMSKTCSTLARSVVGCGSEPGPFVFRYSLSLSSTVITSIQVQELKASSSQTF